MNRCRILVQATTNMGVADLIDLGWSFAHWCDGHVEGYVVTAHPVTTLRVRLAHPQRADMVIAELPGDPAQAADMARMLLQAGHRALLLPPRRGPGDRQWGGWQPAAPASPSLNSEAALCAVVVEQHLRWRGAPRQGHLGDPIASGAIAAVFNGMQPAWPRHRMASPAWPQADRLHLATIGPDGPRAIPGAAGPGLPLGWIVIPARPSGRMSDALDAGTIAFAGGEALDSRLHALVGDEAVRFVLPGSAGNSTTRIRLRAASLLDPQLHRSWEMLRELLLMPQLRADLLATRDPVRRRRILLLEDDDLVGAGAMPGHGGGP